MKNVVRNNSIESTDAEHSSGPVEVRASYESPTLSVVDLADLLRGPGGSGNDTFSGRNPDT